MNFCHAYALAQAKLVIALTERNEANLRTGIRYQVTCPLLPDYGRQRYIMIFAFASSSTKTRYSPSARLWARTA